MTIKFSEFGGYDPTLPITDNQGVGLQSATNVRFPAWYFASSETLTTGVAPVNINPEVYHTKIISGGTGGIEVANFPSVDSSYGGRPHLITFFTRTNSNDQISITSSSNMLVTPFGFNAPEDDTPSAFTSLFFSSEEDGALLTWSETGYVGSGWQIIKLFNFPDLTYKTAAQMIFVNDGQSVLVQDTDGSLTAYDDPQNPNFSVRVTASADINNPTIIPANVRYVEIISTGTGGRGYVDMDIPNAAQGSYGLQKVIYLYQIVASGDTVVFGSDQLYNTNIRPFDSFALSASYRIFVCEFSRLGWIFLGSESTVTPIPYFSDDLITPRGVGYIVGAQEPYIEQHTAGEAVVGIGVDDGQNYKCYTNSGSLTYALPIGRASGYIYSFSVTTAGTLTVNVPYPTALYYAGVSYNQPTFSSSQLGATISFRDSVVSPEGYTIESMTGTWSFVPIALTTVPTFVNAASATTDTTTIAPSLPGARVNGNLLLAWCRVTGSAPGTLSVSAGWTIGLSINTGGNTVFHTACVAYRFVTGAEAAPTFTFTSGGAGTQTLSAQVAQYTGTIAASPIGSVRGACYDGVQGTNVSGGPYPINCPKMWTQFPCSTIVNIAMVNPGVVSAPSTPTSFTSRNTTTQEARISDTTVSGGVYAFSISLTDTGESNWTEFMLELRSQ